MVSNTVYYTVFLWYILYYVRPHPRSYVVMSWWRRTWQCCCCTTSQSSQMWFLTAGAAVRKTWKNVIPWRNLSTNVVTFHSDSTTQWVYNKLYDKLCRKNWTSRESTAIHKSTTSCMAQVHIKLKAYNKSSRNLCSVHQALNKKILFKRFILRWEKRNNVGYFDSVFCNLSICYWKLVGVSFNHENTSNNQKLIHW